MSPAVNEAKTKSSGWEEVCSPSAPFLSELLCFERRSDVSHKSICTVKLGGTRWNTLSLRSQAFHLSPHSWVHTEYLLASSSWLEESETSSIRTSQSLLRDGFILEEFLDWMKQRKQQLLQWSIPLRYTQNASSSFQLTGEHITSELVPFQITHQITPFWLCVSGDLWHILATHVQSQESLSSCLEAAAFPVTMKKSDDRNVLKSVE